MLKVQVFSDRFVTKDNPNGKHIIDIDTPYGVGVFGGAEAVAEHKRIMKISAKMREMAEEKLISEGEL